jgi:hypothetical protein
MIFNIQPVQVLKNAFPEKNMRKQEIETKKHEISCHERQSPRVDVTQTMIK